MEEYFIQVKDHAGKVFTVPIARFPFTIGRVNESDLVLAEPSVSKTHAFIRRQGDSLAIVDDGSRNGVYVNKDRLLPGKPRLLDLNDTIRIGMNRLKLGISVNPEIPAQSSGSETLTFVPSREAWDPVEKIRTSLSEASARKPGMGRAPRWAGKVSDLLLAPTLAASYELGLEMIEEAVSFDRCFIILFEKGGEDRMTIVAMRVYRNKECDVFASRSLLDRVARSREAVLVTSEDSCARLSDSFIRSGAAAAICVPLVAGGRVSGVIYLDRQSSSPGLTAGDIDAIGPLAGLMALKIENFRLVKEQIAAELMARDLDLAKSIQESLFPQDPVAIPGYAVEGFSSPCYQVGGDYYDFLPQEDSKLILAIGDVSGKGLSSAMYMASVCSALRAHAEAGREVEALMSRLEEHIKATFRSDHFLTLFLGVLDPKTGVLRYANAGHPPPFGLREGGEPYELEVTDPALNITAWGTFRRHEHQLTPGELLLFYTDGLIEAEDTGGEQFGTERLASCLERNRHRDLASIRREILQATETFAGERGPGDDRTLILLRRERD